MSCDDQLDELAASAPTLSIAAALLFRTTDHDVASIPIQPAVMQVPYPGLGGSCQLLSFKPCRALPEPAVAPSMLYRSRPWIRVL